MHLPPLQLIDHTHFYTEGEVVIDPSAAIAPGVVFQAEPSSRIVIKAGVCIGAGTVLHARGGTLNLEAGVSLGAGVLIVGQGRVGAHACIGSAATLIQPAIAPGEIVPPGTLLGDNSRQVAIADAVETTAAEVPEPSAEEPQTPPAPAETTTTPVQPAESESEARSPQSSNQPSPSPSPAEPTSSSASDESASAVGVQVYGQGQVRQLIEALFPHRQPLNNSSELPSESNHS